MKLKNNYYLGKKLKDGTHSIWLHIGHYKNCEKHVYLVNTELSIPRAFWSMEAQLAKKSYPSAKVVNRTLDIVKERTEAQIRTIFEDDPMITFDDLKVKLDEKLKGREATIWSVFDDFLKTRKTLQNQQKFKRLKLLLKEFERDTAYRLSLSRISRTVFYDRFIEYMSEKVYGKEKENYSKNTIYKMISFLKVFLNWAVRRDYDVSMQFKGFEVKEEEKKVIHLSIPELEKITKYEIRDDLRLERVRDILMFLCWTGQRFGDVNKISWEQIDGNIWTLTQEKTNTQVSVILLPGAMEVVTKYKGLAHSSPLPKISNQKFNTYVKELCQKAGLTNNITLRHQKGNGMQEKTYEKWELVSSHIGRRSFVTNAREMGLSPDVIMAQTGHKSQRIYKKYQALTMNTRRKEMEQVFGTHLKSIK